MSLRDAIKKMQPEQPPAPVQSSKALVPSEDAEIGPDYGPCMAACTERERKFVLARIIPDVSDAEAARIAGYGHENSSANTMARIAFRLTHENPRVAAAIQEIVKIAVRDLSIDSIKALRKIVRTDFHKDQAKVALAIVERVDPTVTRVETKVEVTVNQAERAVDYLAHLISKGATEQLLLNEFGPGGLSRYRKLLAAREQQKPIDAEYTVIEEQPK